LATPADEDVRLKVHVTPEHEALKAAGGADLTSQSGGACAVAPAGQTSRATTDQRRNAGDGRAGKASRLIGILMRQDSPLSLREATDGCNLGMGSV
jgi:hypothetical protein